MQGESATLCIHFPERNIRMAYKIEVDQYSVITIGGGFQLAVKMAEKLEEENKAITLLAQIGNNVTSFPSVIFLFNCKIQIYYKKKDNLIFPLFNLVIKVNKGKITDIVWDNQCYACEVNGACWRDNVTSIINNTDISEYSNCLAKMCGTNDSSSVDCDPKFYITWFGTDKDKRQLKSSNLAMSKFKQYSIGSLYNSAKDIFNSTIETLKETYEDVKKKVEDLVK